MRTKRPAHPRPGRRTAPKLLGILVILLGVVKIPGGSSEPYAGIYHPHFVVDSYPLVQPGEAHIWMAGEPLQSTQACGSQVDGNQLAVASWYYPCGTHLRVWSLKTGRSVTAVVTDRGPDVMNYPNNIVDVSPAVAAAIGHESSGLVLVHPWFAFDSSGTATAHR